MGKLRKTEAENEGTLENWGGKKTETTKKFKKSWYRMEIENNYETMWKIMKNMKWIKIGPDSAAGIEMCPNWYGTWPHLHQYGFLSRWFTPYSLNPLHPLLKGAYSTLAFFVITIWLFNIAMENPL